MTLSTTFDPTHRDGIVGGCRLREREHLAGALHGRWDRRPQRAGHSKDPSMPPQSPGLPPTLIGLACAGCFFDGNVQLAIGPTEVFR